MKLIREGCLCRRWDDAEPLRSLRFCVQYDPELQKAFQQVFGKTCVCRDLTIAAAYVKSHGINTITQDGNVVGHERFTDVFIKQDGKWLALAAHETKF